MLEESIVVDFEEQRVIVIGRKRFGGVWGSANVSVFDLGGGYKCNLSL